MPDIDVGSIDDLRASGCITAKAGSQPICVFWHEGKAFAVDDRCPHMGFPLHRGTVESGIVTCHWHHARFDLESGGTLDPFADDVRAYPVSIDGTRVRVTVEPDPARVAHLKERLAESLEHGFALVAAKSVLGLREAGLDDTDIVRLGVEWGTAYRDNGWGSGLTVLAAMANLLPHLDEDTRPLALVHGLDFVSGDTRGRPPRFPLRPLERQPEPSRLASWYRRFIETRSADAAERSLVTAVAAGGAPAVHDSMFTAATDHVFLDEGHVVDFTNKAFETVELLGAETAETVLPTLVTMTARAQRHEELSSWRHPHDLVALIDQATDELTKLVAAGEPHRGQWTAVGDLGWQLLDDDPAAVIEAVCGAIAAGATPEQLGRAVAFAAALRITRFHVQNDHGDWNVVHHGFTAANGLHHALQRGESPDLLRGVFHAAMKVYLDRFLNVPAARLPDATTGDLADLQACWDEQGKVNEAGAIVAGYLRGGGSPDLAVAALGRALLAEDAGFHWYQVVEAGVRQFHAWPEGSEEGILILSGVARFLAAHTPTRRELAQVVHIATRLRRGEALYEEE